MEEVIWKGYPNKDRKRYKVTLSKEKFEELWKKFKKRKYSQEDFYFRFVNPFKLVEPKKIKER